MKVQLKGNAERFFHHCLEQCTLAEMVGWCLVGVDDRQCEEWGISGREWQSAVYLAMKRMRAA